MHFIKHQVEAEIWKNIKYEIIKRNIPKVFGSQPVESDS